MAMGRVILPNSWGRRKDGVMMALFILANEATFV